MTDAVGVLAELERSSEVQQTDECVSVSGQKMSRASRYIPYLLLPFSIGLIIWFVHVSFATYNFTTQQTLDFRPYEDVFTRLPRNLNLFVLLLVFLASAVGPGSLLLAPLRLRWRDAAEEALFSLGTGLIAYTFIILVVGSLGFLRQWACYAMLAFATFLTIWVVIQRAQFWRKHQAASARAAEAPNDRGIAWSVWLGLVLALYLYVALLGALSPETQFDARWYHLGQVRSYVLEGRFYNYVKETHIVASALDPYQMVLYAALWSMHGMLEAKILHWGDALLTAFALIYFCRAHFRSVPLGLLAALFFVSTPVVAWSAGTAGNDLQLCLYTLLSVHAFLRWKEAPRSVSWLLVLGLLSGYAFASKSNALFGLVTVFGAVSLITVYQAIREKYAATRVMSIWARAVLITACGVLVACLPWLARSYVETGNPLFPSFNAFFHSRYAQGQAVVPGVKAFHFGPLMQSLLANAWRSLTVQIDYRAVFGPLFIVALPMCILIILLKRHAHIGTLRLLSGYVMAWIGLWFIWAGFSNNLELRYVEPVLALMAVLVAFPIVGWRPAGWQGSVLQLGFALIAGFITLLNFQPFIPLQKTAADLNSFAAPRVAFGYLYRNEPESSVQLQFIPMIVYINQHLSSKNDKVYDASALELYAGYCDVKIFHGTAALGVPESWDLYSPDALEHFAEERITHVSILAQDMDKLRRAAIFHSLREIHSTPDGQILFKVIYGA